MIHEAFAARDHLGEPFARGLVFDLHGTFAEEGLEPLLVQGLAVPDRGQKAVGLAVVADLQERERPRRVRAARVVVAVRLAPRAARVCMAAGCDAGKSEKYAESKGVHVG